MRKRKQAVDPKADFKLSPELYRVKLNCKIGREFITGDVAVTPGATPIEHAIFCLCHAIEDLAEHELKQLKTKNKQ